MNTLRQYLERGSRRRSTMIDESRRRLLETMSIGSAVIALSACAPGQGIPSGPTVASWLATAQQVISEFSADIPALSAIPGLPPNILAALQKASPTLTSIEQQLGMASSQTGAQPVLTQLVNLVGPLITDVLPFVGATTPIGLALLAVSVLLPTLVNVAGSIGLTATARMRAVAARATITVEQAHKILAQRAVERAMRR